MENRYQEILAKHNQDKQAMLNEITKTEKKISDEQNKLDQLSQVKIPKNASLQDLLTLSDLLDNI